MGKFDKSCCPIVVKEAKREICVRMRTGESWTLLEVVETNLYGDVVVKYFDPDGSPAVKVAADDIECILYGAACVACCGEDEVVTTNTNTTNKTGSATFTGSVVVDAALLLSTAPVGSKLIGVDVTVKVGNPVISGSLALPTGSVPVVAGAVYTQTWSSRDPAQLDDFKYTLAVGDVVDVFWLTSL